MNPVEQSFRLEGRVAIVTGGAGMLGRQFARALLGAGAKVVVADVRLDAAKEAAKQAVDAAGGDAVPIAADVTKREDVDRLVSSTVDRWGSVDVLINNAAIDPKFDAGASKKNSYAFEDYPLEAWQQSLDVNLTGAFLCAQAAGKVMVRQRRGVMINICSIYGLVAPDQRLYETGDGAPLYKPASYAVTKAGIAQLTRYLAAYWGDKGIRVNSLTPGGIQNEQDESFVRKYAQRTPMGRMGKKEELGAALLFLASDASSYVTGSNIVVDGGWTAW